MSKEEELFSLCAEYLELKEVRDHYADSMKDISANINDIMKKKDWGAYKEGIVGVSMVNGSKMSTATLIGKLTEAGVEAETIADAILASKPKPKYGPRISKLNTLVDKTITRGIGG